MGVESSLAYRNPSTPNSLSPDGGLSVLYTENRIISSSLTDFACYQDVRRQVAPANRLEILDEIYFVRQVEEQFLDGEIHANTLI
ncbi:hypothetical protein N7499_004316 [Penicillium canescens]|nr:hypothetical protein N7499_004316 [Penicillium canescens]KAJ6161473.1 hypothetical protein N7485_009703 [Penicillium canescens]